METLLFGGALLVAITFFIYKESPLAWRSHYSHGLINPNHAATYMGLLLLLSFNRQYQFYRTLRKGSPLHFIDTVRNFSLRTCLKAFLLLFCSILFLAALFSTASRGGIAVTFLGCACFIALVAFNTLRSGKNRIYARYGILFFTLLLASLSYWGMQEYGSLLNQAWQKEGISTEHRPQLYISALRMIADHPLLGVGLGNFAPQFQSYRPASISPEGLHHSVHNSYLQLTVELGITVLILIVLGLVSLTWYYGKNYLSYRSLHLPSVTGLSLLTLLGLHSMIDFPLQIPALSVLAISLLVLCTSRQKLSSHHSSGERIKRTKVRKRRRAATA